MARFVFKADAGPATGYGHFVRSVALASYLRHVAGLELPLLFVSRPDQPGMPLSSFQRLTLDEIEADYISISDDQDFPSLLEKDDVVVLDNYYYSPEYQREVGRHAAAVVCLHDMPGHSFDCRMVISGTPLPRSAYNMAPDTLYYSGLEYIPLREPFFAPVPVARPSLDTGGTVVMAMGGADPLRLAERLAPALRLAFPSSLIVVVGGHDVFQINGVEVMKGLSAAEMATLFDCSSLGIFPASTVCIEALSRKLPILTGRFTSNQDYLNAYLTKKGYAGSLGDLQQLAALQPEEAALRIKAAVSGLFPVPRPAAIDFVGGRDRIARTILAL